MTAPDYQAVAARLGGIGLRLRGGFHATGDDALPEVSPGRPTRTVLMVGNAGPDLWQVFGSLRHADANPLDTWVAEALGPLATAWGMMAVYPNDRPHRPFQRWAQRSENVQTSPLGLLIHPDYGLWHAYRAALFVAETMELPDRDTRPSPCETCMERPCLSACPVGAFTGERYDVPACAGYLAGERGNDCRLGGCQARDACPIGTAYRYPDPQIRFHMAAFNRAVNE